MPREKRAAVNGVPLWIVGRGGLLGSRIAAALAQHLPEALSWNGPVAKFAWGEPAVLAEQLELAAAEFAQTVHANGQPWIVVWAAGAGVIGTAEAALATETRSCEQLLTFLDRYLGWATERLPGFLFHSSSAGGVFGNCPDRPITEASPCQPISLYGHNKLRQEALVQTWADAHPGTGCLIGRIANLYGPGQNLSKPQGLISHLSRSLIWQQPVHIYVPLDTIRDYLYVDDCAEQICRCLAQWLRDPGAARPRQERVKIFAAGRPTSLAQIIGAFSRLACRRHPRVICAPSRLSMQQPSRLEFRSIVAPHLETSRGTPLQIGINQVHQYHLELYCRGQLPRV
jgi:UDP-glucose 4-epimerase